LTSLKFTTKEQKSGSMFLLSIIHATLNKIGY